MINHPVGVFLYLVLRNDHGWRLLSPEEREIIRRANLLYNTTRDDYADAERYGENRMEGGENWESTSDRRSTVRGEFLLATLDRHRPEAVLEIGPGPGFLTRSLCEHPSVREYVAVDISRSFLDYLGPRLEGVRRQKPFAFELVHGELAVLPQGRRFDLIVLLSAVHHIPDRVRLFREVKEHLSDRGAILCFDPAHSLVRRVGLARAFVSSGYYRRSFFLDRKNLSTHHFCSFGEYQAIVRKVGGLRIESEAYVFPPKLARLARFPRPLARHFSSEMGVVIRRT